MPDAADSQPPDFSTEARCCRRTSRLTTINIAQPTATNNERGRGTWPRLKRAWSRICLHSQFKLMYTAPSGVLHLVHADQPGSVRGCHAAVKWDSFEAWCWSARAWLADIMLRGCSIVCGRSSWVACPGHVVLNHSFVFAFCPSTYMKQECNKDFRTEFHA
ncbi:hypothetical protein P280DRAFT_78690 [Massarina eburnea CBS 473.64]|uniref:Uncharacterized protein n=1 Tax=Massarina eburnea CBS 473.64 TaxID=1395130 RepID=A0A6A6RSP0_9PLEO|nr:hypothetical protein P280DRAFT_78690 [Massarina eburnea CBS 473.64]